MTDGGLHQMRRRPAVEGVRDMGVAEPVHAHVSRQTGAGGGGLENAVGLRAAERAALGAAEHRRIGTGVAAQPLQGAPGLRRQQHGAGPAALAEDRDLAGIVAGGRSRQRRPASSEMRSPAA